MAMRLMIFALLAICSAVQAARPANILPNPDFEQGLEGWDVSRNAEFNIDREVRREGKQSVRITVPADTADRQPLVETPAVCHC